MLNVRNVNVPAHAHISFAALKMHTLRDTDVNLHVKLIFLIQSFSIFPSIPTLQLNSGSHTVNDCCQNKSLTKCQIYIAKGQREQHSCKLKLAMKIKC